LKTTKDVFIENLKRLRKLRFPSQGLFASKVRLSERGYQKYEQGETDPTPETIDRFAGELGCHPLDLLTDPEDPLRSAAPIKGDLRSKIEVETLRQMIERPERFDSLYLANLLSQQFEVAPAEMRALALRALFARQELLDPYREQLVEAAEAADPKLGRKKRPK
jgi:transcriptional regulator with XRE-family HTH domain